MRLTAQHKDAKGEDWKKHKADIGVDSGQASIFDSGAFPDGDRDDPLKASFYDRCCEATDNNVGIVDNGGIVSCSGFGDGGYTLEVQYEGDKIVAARVTFISEEDDREEESEEWEEEIDEEVVEEAWREVVTKALK